MEVRKTIDSFLTCNAFLTALTRRMDCHRLEIREGTRAWLRVLFTLASLQETIDFGRKVTAVNRHQGKTYITANMKDALA